MGGGGRERRGAQSGVESSDTPALAEAVVLRNKKDKVREEKRIFPPAPYPFYSVRLIAGKNEECPDTIGAGAIMKKFIYVC